MASVNGRRGRWTQTLMLFPATSLLLETYRRVTTQTDARIHAVIGHFGNENNRFSRRTYESSSVKIRCQMVKMTRSTTSPDATLPRLC